MKVNASMVYSCFFSFIYATLVICTNQTVSFLAFVATTLALVVLDKKLQSVLCFFLFVLINMKLANISFCSIYVGWIVTIINITVLARWLMFKKSIFDEIRKKWILYLFAWGAYCAILTYLIESDSFVNASASMVSNISLCLIALCLEKKNRKMFVQIVTFSVLFMVLLGYLELAINKTFFYSTWTGEERYRFGLLRVGSTMADPNFLCSVLVPMFYILQLKNVTNINGKKLTRVLCSLIVVLVITTFSRTGIFLLALGLVIVYACNSLVKTVLFIPMIAGIALAGKNIAENILNYQVESKNTRFAIAKISMLEWADSPIYGHGWNWFVQNSEAFFGAPWETMNTYMYVLVNLGIIGMFFLLGYYIKISRKTFVKWIHFNHKAGSDESLLLACLACWVIMTYTLDEFNVPFMWLLPAIFSICERRDENETYANS